MNDMFTEEERKSIHICDMMKIKRTLRKLHIHMNVFHFISAHSLWNTKTNYCLVEHCEKL
jgi:hypothetical protein